MSDIKNIFPEEIELSEIVLNKTNQAFETIQQEDTDYMKKTNMKDRKSFKKQAAAIAGVCILAVSSISAAAAIRHYWGRGMQGNLQASDSQQQELTDNGVAKIYREEPEYRSLAVTDNGITIAPDTVIVDDRFAYMSFSISGFSVVDGEEPGFDRVNVYQRENSEDAGSWVNMYGARMYDGIIPDENMKAMYEDGSPLEFYEDGSLIQHYTDDNGDMEYIINIGVDNDSLLGKTIHVELQDLGTSSYAIVSDEPKYEFSTKVEGNWNFEIVLPDVSSAKDIEVGQEIEGTGFVMESVSISPISMKVNYSVIEAPEVNGDELGIPEVKGVVLKDGTRIPYLLSGGGGVGYTDLSMSAACQYASYYRVIDVDEVAALIVLTSYENDKVEIPISK